MESDRLASISFCFSLDENDSNNPWEPLITTSGNAEDLPPYIGFVPGDIFEELASFYEAQQDKLLEELKSLDATLKPHEYDIWKEKAQRLEEWMMLLTSEEDALSGGYGHKEITETWTSSFCDPRIAEHLSEPGEEVRALVRKLCDKVKELLNEDSDEESSDSQEYDSC